MSETNYIRWPIDWTSGDVITAEKLNKDSVVVFPVMPDFTTIYDLASAGVARFVINNIFFYLTAIDSNNVTIVNLNEESITTAAFNTNSTTVTCVNFTDGTTQRSTYDYSLGDFVDVVIEPLMTTPVYTIDFDNNSTLTCGSDTVSYLDVKQLIAPNNVIGSDSRVPLLMYNSVSNQSTTGYDNYSIQRLTGVSYFGNEYIATFSDGLNTIIFASDTQLGPLILKSTESESPK